MWGVAVQVSCSSFSRSLSSFAAPTVPLSMLRPAEIPTTRCMVDMVGELASCASTSRDLPHQRMGNTTMLLKFISKILISKEDAPTCLREVYQHIPYYLFFPTDSIYLLQRHRP